jgi:hypothetical protein
MPRPRKYASNAERQAAYRARLKKKDGPSQVAARVMRADRAAQGRDA